MKIQQELNAVKGKMKKIKKKIKFLRAEEKRLAEMEILLKDRLLKEMSRNDG